MVLVKVGDQDIELRGRAAAMVTWLALRAEHFDGTQRMKVEFDCAGSKVRPRYVVFGDEPPIKMEESHLFD